MHRTEGIDYVLEDGLRRFHDQELPAYPGTKDPAEFSNAVQEELANVIDHAGMTISPSAAADRAAGWHQLRDAIFLMGKINTSALAVDAVTSQKITNGAVTNNKLSADLSLDKFDRGNLDINYSAEATNLKMGFAEISLKKDLGGGNYEQAEMLPYARYDGATVHLKSNSEGGVLESALTKRGIDAQVASLGTTQGFYLHSTRESDGQAFLKIYENSGRYAELAPRRLAFKDDGKITKYAHDSIYINPVGKDYKMSFAGTYLAIKNFTTENRQYNTGSYCASSRINDGLRDTSVRHLKFVSDTINVSSYTYFKSTSADANQVGIKQGSSLVEIGLSKNAVPLQSSMRYKVDGYWYNSPVSFKRYPGGSGNNMLVGNMIIFTGPNVNIADITDAELVIEFDGTTL